MTDLVWESDRDPILRYLERKDELLRQEARENPPREFVAEDNYQVTGRGQVFSGKDLDPVIQRGEKILCQGRVGRVTAIERFLPAREPQPGDSIGILLTGAVCMACGSGITAKGEHIRDDLEPCYGESS